MSIVKEQSVKLEGKLDGVGILKIIESVGRVSWASDDKNPDDDFEITKSFVKALMNRNHVSVIEFGGMVTFRVYTNRAIANELVRHRLASYCQNSTRYIKYREELSVIAPYSVVPGTESFDLWKNSVEVIEETYHNMIDNGVTAQNARDILPLCLGTEIMVSMNLRSWLNFFQLRTYKSAHPQMREIAIKMYNILKSEIPVIFDGLDVKPFKGKKREIK